MKVLIVESCTKLGQLWKRHLERHGMDVVLHHTQDDAVSYLSENEPQIIILNLVLTDGGALAVADFANYRMPKAQVIFVSNTSFFSDGSISRHCANACAYLQSQTEPADLAAMVEHYAGQRVAAGRSV